MVTTARLEGAAREQALKALSAWQNVQGRDAIERHLRFNDFSAAALKSLKRRCLSIASRP